MRARRRLMEKPFQPQLPPAERSNPREVLAGAGIDPDPVSLIYKKRHLYDEAGLQRGRLRATGRRVALETGIRLRHLKVDVGRRIDVNDFPIRG